MDTSIERSDNFPYMLISEDQSSAFHGEIV